MNYCSNKIKFIAVDIDGTITNKSNAIPNSLLANIRIIMGLGIKFIICTARDVDNTLFFLKQYFTIQEISHFGFVTSAGSDVYIVNIVNNKVSLQKIYGFEFDLNIIMSDLRFKTFIEENRHKMIIKKTAILIPFKNKNIAMRNLKKIRNKISISPLKAYLYNTTLVLSLKTINKNRGLRVFMDRYNIKNFEIFRLADQGGENEADYEFLNFKNGFTVGSKNKKEIKKCNYIINNENKILKGVIASNYFFRKYNL